MSVWNIDTSLDELAGIWAHIVKYSPPQEFNEIKKVVGSDVIEDNQSLWREVKALKSILFEMGSNSLDNIVRQSNVGRGGKHSIAKAKNFSNLYYTQGKENEFNIYSIKTFSLDSITSDLSDIKDAMEAEHTFLEKEVNHLNNEMDNQSESMISLDESTSGLNSNFSSMDLSSMTCSICKSKLSMIVDPSRRGQLPNSSSSSSRFNNSLQTYTCSICKEKKSIQESKLYGSNVGRNTGTRHPDETFIQDFSQKLFLSSQSEAILQHSPLSSSNSYLSSDSNDDHRPRGSNNNDSPPGSLSLSVPVSSRSSLSSGGRGSTSKFRSRLNSARDELHFLDEF
jgi:hypothetical protein